MRKGEKDIIFLSALSFPTWNELDFLCTFLQSEKYKKNKYVKLISAMYAAKVGEAIRMIFIHMLITLYFPTPKGESRQASLTLKDVATYVIWISLCAFFS